MIRFLASFASDQETDRAQAVKIKTKIARIEFVQRINRS